MRPISYRRHQFPADIIRHAIWLYLRFTLSYRDVEELLAERGIETSYETVRRWVSKFGPAFARNLRRLRPRPTGRWHLDEMVKLSANSPKRGAEGDPCSPPSMSACFPQLRSTAPNGGAPATEPIRRQYPHLVEVPPSMRIRAFRPQPSCDRRTEGEHPAPDGFVRDHDAALGQELLDIAEAEREPEVHPHGTLDDVARKAITRIRKWAHAVRLRHRAG